MPRNRINVAMETAWRPDLRPAWVRHVVSRTLALSGVSRGVEVDVLLAGDAQMRRLNRDYRGIDRTTDVLSFALHESRAPFPPVPGGVPSLGQVVVSYPQAVRQARAYGHSVQREVAFLLVHGVLHLLGYDHQDAKEEARMLDQQEAVLTSLGIRRDEAPLEKP